jgi:hypothetical protein
LDDKLPEVLDFSKDLANLEAAAKVANFSHSHLFIVLIAIVYLRTDRTNLIQIQLKFLAEEMQAINKGLEKVVQELSTSENDGPISETFRKV